MGMRIETWTGLCRKSKAHPVFDRAERAKRDLDPLLVVPADVRVDRLDDCSMVAFFSSPEDRTAVSVQSNHLESLLGA